MIIPVHEVGVLVIWCIPNASFSTSSFLLFNIIIINNTTTTVINCTIKVISSLAFSYHVGSSKHGAKVSKYCCSIEKGLFSCLPTFYLPWFLVIIFFLRFSMD